LLLQQLLEGIQESIDAVRFGHGDTVGPFRGERR
jgi:hypothetical protein